MTAHPVDLTNCDREPIQFLGRIQSHGYLVAVSRDWTIRYLSENCGELFGAAVEEVLGGSARQWFSTRAVHRMGGMLQLIVNSDHVEHAFSARLFDDDDRTFNVAVHVSGEFYVIEVEPCAPRADHGTSAYVGSMIDRLRAIADIREMEDAACRFMRSLTGFDRVMVYRFMDDGVGEVVAESVAEGRESYLGLRYPASDIPAQARELYRRNMIRVIADASDPAVGIVGQKGQDGTGLDLSHSVFRAVSEIHLEYLRNMGVAASFSASILRDADLAGLFACHHYQPRNLPLERRAAVELFARMFSHLRFLRENQQVQAHLERTFDRQSELMDMLRDSRPAAERADMLIERLAGFVDADGVAMHLGGYVRLAGETPGAEVCGELVRHLAAREAGEMFVTDRLDEDFPDAPHIAADVAGVLAVPIADGRSDYVMFLRKPVTSVVRWAGNPEKPVQRDSGGDRLSPRQSFAEWRETVRGRSEPWSASDIATAKRLRLVLYDIAVRMRDAVAKERERQQAHQDILIAELNHRVRNILNLIRNVIGQTDARGLTVAQFSEVVSGRIEAMARAHDHIARRGWEDVSLMALLETEFSAFLDDGDAGRVTAEGPAVRLTAEAFSTISLVIHELLTNAVKHGALAGAGSVSIDWSLQPEGLELNWLEHGVPDLAPPERRGFGRTVIERLIPFDLKGEAEIEFAPGGLRCRFIVPDLHLRRSEGEAPRSAPRISPTPRLAAAERRQTSPAAKQEGKILIVEDNLLIALEYESIAFRAGVEEVVTVSGTKDALRAAEDRPRLAILDINLGTETTLPVARRLHELGVPLIFVTGYGEELTESTKGLAKKTFAKPVDNELLFASIAEILRASGKSDDP